MHIHQSEALPVLDEKRYLMGVGAFRGFAIFPGEEVVRHRYDGWFDLADGSGPFHGYALWVFGDGSTLRARYDDAVTTIAKDDAEVSATFHDFSGTGRFDNVQGDGNFAGRRFEAIDKARATYLKGTLFLKTGN